MSAGEGICDGCNSDLALCDWDQESDLCDKCQREAIRDDEMESLELRVRALAAQHEWEVTDRRRSRETLSVYLTLERECDACVLDLDRDCSCEALKVRISDHATCYCSEDVSLVTPSGSASGDDHTIETLVRRLAR